MSIREKFKLSKSCLLAQRHPGQYVLNFSGMVQCKCVGPKFGPR